MKVDPDNSTDKRGASSANFLGKLWKSRRDLPDSIVALDVPVTADDATESSSLSVPEVEPTVVELQQSVMPTVTNAPSSQFLAKLWKAQKGVVSPVAYDDSDTVNSGNDIEQDLPVENATQMKPPDSVQDASTAALGSVPESVQDPSVTINGETTDSSVQEIEDNPPLNEIDRPSSAVVAGTGGSGLNAPIESSVAEAATEPIVDAVAQAQAQRKNAIELYGQMKAEQKLKSERAATAYKPFGESPGEQGAGDSSVASSSSHTPPIEPLQSHMAAVAALKPAPTAAPPAAPAASIVKKHPYAVLISIAAVAAIIAYAPTQHEETATATVKEGEQQRTYGNTQEAIGLFNKAIATDPALGSAYVSRGKAYEQTGDKEKAFADYDKALTLAATNVDALTARAMLNLESGRFRKAISDLEKISSSQGMLPPDLYGALGRAYLGDGQYSMALTQFSKRLDRQPEDVQALLGRASCYRALNQLHKAIAECVHALKIDSKSYDALVLKGRCEAQLGENEEAVGYFNRAIALDATRSEAFIARGGYYALQKKFGESLADFGQALKLNGSSPNGNYELALAYARKGDKTKALELFAALEKKPDFQRDNWFLIQRASVRNILGDGKGAIADLESAQANDRAYITTCWLRLSEYYAAAGDFKKAAKYAGKVLEDEPANPLALIEHSKYSRLSGNQMTALDDLYKAIQVDPRNPAAYSDRGDIYVATKQMNMAAQDYRKAYELDPDYPGLKKKFVDTNQQVKVAKVSQSSDSSKPLLSQSAQKEIAGADPAQLKTKGYQALKRNDISYAIAAFTRAVSMNPNDGNSRRYLAHALLKIGDTSQAEQQFYAWEKLTNPDPNSELAFARMMATTSDADRTQNVLEHIAERYRENAPILLAVARTSQALGFPAVATSALEFGCRVASSDELVQFNRLRVSLQQSAVSHQDNGPNARPAASSSASSSSAGGSTAAPSNLPGAIPGKKVEVQN